MYEVFNVYIPGHDQPKVRRRPVPVLTLQAVTDACTDRAAHDEAIANAPTGTKFERIVRLK